MKMICRLDDYIARKTVWIVTETAYSFLRMMQLKFLLRVQSLLKIIYK